MPTHTNSGSIDLSRTQKAGVVYFLHVHVIILQKTFSECTVKGEYTLGRRDSINITSHSDFWEEYYGNDIESIWSFQTQLGYLLEVELLSFEVRTQQ